MARSQIVVAPNPRGVFKEGIIYGTPKPGIVCTIKAGVAEDGTGRFTWEPYNGDAADGERVLIAVLIEDKMQGKTSTQAYADGDRCFLYCPVPGEELMMITENIDGTSDDYSVGQKLILNDGTGKLIATTGGPESEPFVCLEAASDQTDDTLRLVMFTGY